ncbi:hypothetical protein OIV83_004356 [Microbotryomycetes sp. JL201]|nr:hypothetical protein OIV83_004356 [Microbotryomycetes sp. JL201]
MPNRAKAAAPFTKSLSNLEMSSTMLVLVTSLVALVAGIALVLRPASTPVTIETTARQFKLNGQPLEHPGPVAASVCRDLDLSGLTIIPLVKLPSIKVRIAVPFVKSKRIKITVASTASEVVFSDLRIRELTHKAADVGRKPMAIRITDVDSDLRGLFGTRVTVALETVEAGKAAHVSKGWRWSGSGRVDTKLEKSNVALQVQFVQSETEGEPAQLEVLDCVIDEGNIDRLIVEGFGVWGGLATRFTPALKSTWLVKRSIQLIGDYLVREIVEREVVSDIVRSAWPPISKHIDPSTFEAIKDDERDGAAAEEIKAPNLLARPNSPLGPGRKSPEPKRNSAAVSAFRFRASLVGPTILKGFALPDYSPPLYPAGGTRAALQSLNPLTSELKIDITDSVLSKIAFNRSTVSFDPSRVGAGDFVVTVEDLAVTLTSRFSFHADTSNLIAWTTGIKRLGESGTATTKIDARSLEIRFILVPAKDRVEREGHGAPFVLKDSSISPFNTFEPVIEFDRAFLKFGADIANAVSASLKVQIAQAASFVVQRGISRALRKYLQKGMDGVEDKLREAGVELPLELRAKVSATAGVQNEVGGAATPLDTRRSLQSLSNSVELASYLDQTTSGAVCAGSHWLLLPRTSSARKQSARVAERSTINQEKTERRFTAEGTHFVQSLVESTTVDHEGWMFGDKRNAKKQKQAAASLAKARDEFRNDVQQLATRLGVRQGRWALYPKPKKLKMIWERLVKAFASPQTALSKTNFVDKLELVRHRNAQGLGMINVHCLDSYDKSRVLEVGRLLYDVVNDQQQTFYARANDLLGINDKHVSGIDPWMYTMKDIKEGCDQVWTAIDEAAIGSSTGMTMLTEGFKLVKKPPRQRIKKPRELKAPSSPNVRKRKAPSSSQKGSNRPPSRPKTSRK